MFIPIHHFFGFFDIFLEGDLETPKTPWIRPWASLLTRRHSAVEQLYSLYLALNETPQRILSVIEEPKVENESQAWVFTYLKKFIGNMKSEVFKICHWYVGVADSHMFQLQF